MDPVVVVGGGIAGVACARELVAAGLAVRLLDRGRGIGGRLGLRERDGQPIDIGAPSFSATDPAFAALAADWRARGLVRPAGAAPGGASRFTGAAPTASRSASPGGLWSATRGLRTVVQDLAAGLPVASGVVVERVEPGAVRCAPPRDGGAAETIAAAAVVLAMPDPQAARLLGHELPGAPVWEPTLVLAAGWSATAAPRGGRGFRDLFPVSSATTNRDDLTLARVIPADGAPILVAHSTPAFATRWLEDPAAAEPELLAALRRLTGTPEPAWSFVHRWTFARPVAARPEPCFVGDDGIGACGDGWYAPAGVEGAFLSGRALGRELVSRLTA